MQMKQRKDGKLALQRDLIYILQRKLHNILQKNLTKQAFTKIRQKISPSQGADLFYILILFYLVTVYRVTEIGVIPSSVAGADTVTRLSFALRTTV